MCWTVKKFTLFFPGEALRCYCGGLKKCTSSIETCHGSGYICGSVPIFDGPSKYFCLHWPWAAVKPIVILIWTANRRRSRRRGKKTSWSILSFACFHRTKLRQGLYDSKSMRNTEQSIGFCYMLQDWSVQQIIENQQNYQCNHYQMNVVLPCSVYFGDITLKPSVFNFGCFLFYTSIFFLKPYFIPMWHNLNFKFTLNSSSESYIPPCSILQFHFTHRHILKWSYFSIWMIIFQDCIVRLWFDW